MALTRKDHEAIAEILREPRDNSLVEQIEYMGTIWIRADILRERLADFCAERDPRFNRALFMAATETT